jgi:hypothetical protein
VLTPASESKGAFVDVLPPSGRYSLSDVRLAMPDSTSAIFRARLNGLESRPVWARAWLSTEAGTLAEVASTQMNAGDEVTLEVTLQASQSPQYAYVRIESAPLKTEHVVGLKLTQG